MHSFTCLFGGVIEGDCGDLVHVVETLRRVSLALVPQLYHAVIGAGNDQGLAAPRGVHRVDVGGVALEALDSEQEGRISEYLTA